MGDSPHLLRLPRSRTDQGCPTDRAASRHRTQHDDGDPPKESGSFGMVSIHNCRDEIKKATNSSLPSLLAEDE